MTSLIEERSVLKTAPAAEPVTTAEAKAHLRVTSSADDTYIDTLVKVARRRIEERTGRALINQTWYLYLDEFPDCDRIRLPKAPLTAITSLKYKDTTGAETTWSSSNYITDLNPTPGELVLTYANTWPAVSLYPASPITVEYTAGYGASGSAVPEELRQAILLAVGHWYENREEVVTGTIVSPLPMQFEWLINPFMAEWFR